VIQEGHDSKLSAISSQTLYWEVREPESTFGYRINGLKSKIPLLGEPYCFWGTVLLMTPPKHKILKWFKNEKRVYYMGLIV